MNRMLETNAEMSTGTVQCERCVMFHYYYHYCQTIRFSCCYFVWYDLFFFGGPLYKCKAT